MTSNYTSTCTNEVNLDQCYTNKINDALTKFNTAFQCYQGGCLNSCAGNTSKCDFYHVVQPAYDNLMGTIREVLSKTAPLDLVNMDASMNQIQSDYQNLLTLRESVDEKMKELGQTKDGNGIPNLYKTDYDVAVYTNTLWVILATSLAYFAFLQMKD